MKVGIFFGGPSREREISFAGGRTAFDHIDKSLFEPVLVFVDGTGRFRLATPDILQHTAIRQILPEVSGFSVYDESLPEDDWSSQYSEIKPDDFKQHFDIAFLAMHGPDCEDGSIQGLFEWYKIPYTGPGLMGSAVGINKILQNELIALVNGQQKKTTVITRDAWLRANKDAFFSSLVEHLGLPVVVKAPHQGSSIGVAIIRDNNLSAFCRAVEQCFFTLTVEPQEWSALSDGDKRDYAQRIANLDESIGYPVVAEQTGTILRSPQALLDFLADHQQPVTLSSVHAEDEVLFEEFITGQEFSCGVIQDDEGMAIALPPTEVYNVTSFDFKSKYQSNTTRKRIPVEASLEHNRKIQQAVAEVFTRLGINVYSRIDGFLTPDGRVLLHDPNTIPGMSPASLIFKQMAEIGMNITNSLTYLIRQSLRERIRTGKDTFRLRQMLTDLDGKLAQRKAQPLPEQTIGFGPTDESFAEAKKEYNRLAAEGKVKPVLVYTKSKLESHELPVYLMFKDTIADLDAAQHQPRHPLVLETAERARHVVAQYL
ncbi:hypothetical protein GCM10023187_16060 [Nibrella viscosa]|uniref:D-alanine--D-alanine ligase n=1 Tax=Nibrella viscosa TaxID=1084524 RepID=A0ABP8K700_9BACT